MPGSSWVSFETLSFIRLLVSSSAAYKTAPGSTLILRNARPPLATAMASSSAAQLLPTFDLPTKRKHPSGKMSGMLHCTGGNSILSKSATLTKSGFHGSFPAGPVPCSGLPSSGLAVSQTLRTGSVPWSPGAPPSSSSAAAGRGGDCCAFGSSHAPTRALPDLCAVSIFLSRSRSGHGGRHVVFHSLSRASAVASSSAASRTSTAAMRKVLGSPPSPWIAGPAARRNRRARSIIDWRLSSVSSTAGLSSFCLVASSATSKRCSGNGGAAAKGFFLGQSPAFS